MVVQYFSHGIRTYYLLIRLSLSQLPRLDIVERSNDDLYELRPERILIGGTHKFKIKNSFNKKIWDFGNCLHVSTS